MAGRGARRGSPESKNAVQRGWDQALTGSRNQWERRCGGTSGSTIISWGLAKAVWKIRAGEADFLQGPARPLGSSRYIEFVNSYVDRSFAPLRSGRERAAAARVWAAPSFQVKEGGAWRLACQLAGWRDDAGLWPGLQRPSLLLVVIGHQPVPSTNLLCSETQAVCWLHSIPYSNPWGSQCPALPSPAPGCWSYCTVPALLPSPTHMPPLLSRFRLSQEMGESVG